MPGSNLLNIRTHFLWRCGGNTCGVVIVVLWSGNAVELLVVRLLAVV